MRSRSYALGALLIAAVFALGYLLEIRDDVENGDRRMSVDASDATGAARPMLQGTRGARRDVSGTSETSVQPADGADTTSDTEDVGPGGLVFRVLSPEGKPVHRAAVVAQYEGDAIVTDPRVSNRVRAASERHIDTIWTDEEGIAVLLRDPDKTLQSVLVLPPLRQPTSMLASLRRGATPLKADPAVPSGHAAGADARTWTSARVRPPFELGTNDVRLGRGVSLEVRLLDTSGGELPNVRVGLYRHEASDPEHAPIFPQEISTDDEGLARFHGLPADRVVRLGCPSPRRIRGGVAYGAVRKVEVNTSVGSTDLQSDLLPRRRVELVGGADDRPYQISASVDGKPVVPAVHALPGGAPSLLPPLPKGTKLELFTLARPGSAWVAYRQLDLPGPEVIRLVLREGKRLSGRVVIPEDVNDQTFNVNVVARGRTTHVRTDSHGFFEATGLLDGPYVITARLRVRGERAVYEGRVETSETRDVQVPVEKSRRRSVVLVVRFAKPAPRGASFSYAFESGGRRYSQSSQRFSADRKLGVFMVSNVPATDIDLSFTLKVDDEETTRTARLSADVNRVEVTFES